MVFAGEAGWRVARAWLADVNGHKGEVLRDQDEGARWVWTVG